MRIQPWPDNCPRQVHLRCPSDKSLTHRALIFASLARGQSTIASPLLADDCLTTVKVLQKLGADIQISPGLIEVASAGWKNWEGRHVQLDFENSGTTARLMIGLLASTPGLRANCVGDASLSKRPMRRVIEPLRAMGAQIFSTGDLLPLEIHGTKLHAMTHDVKVSSAQVKSAIILAGLNCEGKTSVTLPPGSRNHTELFLQNQGISIEIEQTNGCETISTIGPIALMPFHTDIPADPSSAAFFAVLACLHPGLSVQFSDLLANKTRTQFHTKIADSRGGEIKEQTSISKNFCEPTSNITIRGTGKINSFQIASFEAAQMIDEIPILSVLASFADGTSVFSGLAELRVKESDRLAKIYQMLRAANINVEIGEDNLRITGSANPCQGFTFDCAGDHRLAMAAAILATKADAACEIIGAECVSVSYPKFFEDLNNLGTPTLFNH